MAIVQKLKFYNVGVSPAVNMGELPDDTHPHEIGDVFAKEFTNPPVGYDYYAKAVSYHETTYRSSQALEPYSIANGIGFRVATKGE